jgi:hypothetical protein
MSKISISDPNDYWVGPSTKGHMILIKPIDITKFDGPYDTKYFFN